LPAKNEKEHRFRQDRYSTAFRNDKYIVMYCHAGSTYIFAVKFDNEADRADFVRDRLKGFVAVGSLGD
jgi:hypothetical protein